MTLHRSADRPKTKRQWLRPAMSLAVLVALVVTMQVRTADAKDPGYVLAHGKKYALCREYLENIRSVGLADAVALEWPVSSKSKNLQKPKWQPIDAKARLDIVEKIYRTKGIGKFGPGPSADEDAVWERMRPSVLDEIASGVARLEQTQIDINNDGIRDEAFRYGFKAYPIAGGLRSATGEDMLWGWWYWFTGQDNSIEAAWKASAGRLSFNYDLFLYKGRAFLSTYDSEAFRIGKIPDLFVFEPQTVRNVLPLALITVCRFSYPAE